MVIGILLMAAKSDTVEETLQRIAAAHEAYGAGLFRAESKTVIEGHTQSIRYEVGYARPGDFTIKQTTDGSPNPVRVLGKSGQSMMVFDPKTKQYARRIFQSAVTVKDAIGNSGLQVDPVVMAMITPGGMTEWVKQFQKLDTWKFSQTGGVWRLILVGSAGDVSLDVQPQTGRLAGLHAKVNGQTTDWTISYPTGRYAAFQPPGGSFEVAEIDPSLLNPVYADADARKTTEKMFKAFDKPRALAVEVAADGKKYNVWYRPGAVRQVDGNTDWCLDQGTLTVVDHRTLYQGRSTIRETIDRLPQTRSRAEPLTRSLMRGQNYFRFLLGNGEKIKTAGKTQIDGTECTIITARGKDVESTLIVRDRDGYVLSLATTPLGQTMSGTETSFRYLPTDGVVAGRDMRVNAAGTSPRPITDLRLTD